MCTRTDWEHYDVAGADEEFKGYMKKLIGRWRGHDHTFEEMTGYK